MTNNKYELSIVIVCAVIALVLGGIGGANLFPTIQIVEKEVVVKVDVPGPVITNTVTETVEVPADFVNFQGKDYYGSDILEILEITEKKSMFTWIEWFSELFDELEEDEELVYAAERFDEGEWEFDIHVKDWDDVMENCIIRFDDNEDDEGTLSCDSVPIETDDDDDIVCDIEIDFENSDEYDDGKVDDCEED